MQDELRVSAARIEQDRDRVADFCIEEIVLAASEFGEPCADEPTGRKLNALEMHQAAVAMTLRLVEAMDCGGVDEALIAEEDAPDMVARLFLRRYQSERARKRSLARGMSEYVMKRRVAPVLYGSETVVCPERDGRVVRREIAERVERCIVE